MKAWLLFSFLVLAAGLKAQTTAEDGAWEKSLRAAGQTYPELLQPDSVMTQKINALRAQYATSSDPVQRLAYEDNAALYMARIVGPTPKEAMPEEKSVPAEVPAATAGEALAKVNGDKKTASAEKAEGIRQELADLQSEIKLLEEQLQASKESIQAWKETALHNKEVAEKSMASSEANYNAAIEAQEIAEKWKEIALHNQRVAQENARIAQDNADAATAASYRQPASKKASSFIHVINTAEGHWMTTDGTQIIKTGAGQATIIRP